MVKKKDNGISMWKIGFGMLIVFIGFPMSMGQCSKMIDESEDMQGRCEGYGYMDSAYDCCNDCHKLGQKYFRHKYIDRGIMSSDEYTCNCVLNGTVNEIY